MIPIPGKIIKVGKWALGKYGRKEVAKQAAGNGATGVVTGFLVAQAGFDVEVAATVAVVLVTAWNALWEAVKDRAYVAGSGDE